MTTTTDTATDTLLSDEEVALLNQARSLLNMLAKRSSHRKHDHIFALAEVAEHAIFTTLNWIDSYKVQLLTEDQIHNKSVVEVQS